MYGRRGEARGWDENIAVIKAHLISPSLGLAVGMSVHHLPAVGAPLNGLLAGDHLTVIIISETLRLQQMETKRIIVMERFLHNSTTHHAYISLI